MLKKITMMNVILKNMRNSEVPLRKMKGYIDEFGYDRPPCAKCKHKDERTVVSPCYSCIDNVDLALHKPNCETEFTNFEEDLNE